MDAVVEKVEERVLVDLTKFVDWMRWAAFLNHSFFKGEEWNKTVSDEGARGYLISVDPEFFGKLYSKPLLFCGSPSPEMQKRVRDWIEQRKDHPSRHKEHAEIAESIFKDLVGEEQR